MLISCFDYVTMFKFLKDEDAGNETENQVIDGTTNQFVNHQVTQRHYTIASEIPASSYQLSANGTVLKYINVNNLLRSDFVREDEVVRRISTSSSDLISGVYEGGFKIWECTFDLIEFLQGNCHTYPIDSTCKVLDLGCGSGLLGLSALSQGAKVDFHDFNPEVLNYLTIPNVILNHPDEILAQCRYCSGEWASFRRRVTELTSDLRSDFQYDFILSSETVYNVQYLSSLCELIKTCLKPTGTMLLAAKTCYFGVGGGTKSFQNVVQNAGQLEVNVLETFRSGVQREILAVKWSSRQ